MTHLPNPLGEQRHATCRFGRLTEAFECQGRYGPEKAALLPLCLWELPEGAPPAVTRAWGGLVDVDLDCSRCGSYDSL